MLSLLKDLLNKLLYDIDTGNTNISEHDLELMIDLLQKISSLELSKIESANYIGVSRATFDNYVSNGWIPKGRKRLGFKELSWNKADLDKYLKNKK